MLTVNHENSYEIDNDDKTGPASEKQEGNWLHDLSASIAKMKWWLISPVSSLSKSCRTVRWDRFPISGGIEPVLIGDAVGGDRPIKGSQKLYLTRQAHATPDLGEYIMNKDDS